MNNTAGRHSRDTHAARIKRNFHLSWKFDKRTPVTGEELIDDPQPAFETAGSSAPRRKRISITKRSMVTGTGRLKVITATANRDGWRAETTESDITSPGQLLRLSAARCSIRSEVNVRAYPCRRSLETTRENAKSRHVKNECAITVVREEARRGRGEKEEEEEAQTSVNGKRRENEG